MFEDIAFSKFSNIRYKISNIFMLPEGTAHGVQKYFNIATWRMTYNFHSSCKHMHLSFKRMCNKELKRVICNMTS